jgi:hypothetical protein
MVPTTVRYLPVTSLLQSQEDISLEEWLMIPLQYISQALMDQQNQQALL